jgi:hypothetical protein
LNSDPLPQQTFAWREDTILSIEEAYLTEEIETAKAAILQTLNDLKADVISVGDLRPWLFRHAWIAVGAASVAGLAGAALARSAIRSIKSRHSSAKANAAKTTSVDGGCERALPPAGGSKLGWLRGPMFDLSKVLVTTLVTSTVRAMAEHASTADGRQSRSDAR